MTKFNTLDGFDVAGKRVLVRGDLNVPMKEGRVTNTTRIDRTAPTLTELADKGARVIVVSHLGRPKGQVVESMSLRPVAEALSKVCGRPIAFASDCIGEAAAKVVEAMKDGDIAVLENLRFHPEEEKNDAAFAAKLAANADAYVNDAFSTAHRAHASTEAVARLLPSAAGRLMQAELEALTDALESPKHPVAAVIGGAKISTKLEVLGNLSKKVDLLIIGGGMANTFLNAKGVNVGKSLCEHEMAEAAREIMTQASDAACDIVLPTDAVVAAELAEGVKSQTVKIDAVPAEQMILDVGPDSVDELIQLLKGCKTLLWNGPLGAFEVAPFDAGTNVVAQEAARLTEAGKLLSVAGGGDTVAALARAGVGDAFSYVSTAGGAFLEWLEGKELPGVAVLRTDA
jgi:phosphoglycerate kinase